MNSLLDALSAVPDLLAMPGDYARGFLAGAPGERVGGRDLLRRAGLAGPEDTWGNFAAGVATDAATDPLTYLMAFGGSALGKAAQAMIPEAAASAGKAASAGRNALAGAGKFKGPLRDVATVRNVAGYAPGEIVPGDISRVVTSSPGVTGPGGTPAKLGGEMSGRTAGQMGRKEVRGRMDTMLQGGADEFMQGAGGAYDPAGRTIATGRGPDAARAARHERVHAIIDQASQGAGDPSQLPALMRWPAQLRAPGRSHLAQSAGTVMDELAAQTLENRNLGGQLTGALGFLFHPEKNATYARHFGNAGIDPRVLGLYQALPMIPGAAGGAAGAGTSALAAALREGF